MKNINLWRQDFHPCLALTSTHHSVSGGHVESNTSLPSLSSQSGVSAGLVGSLNSYPHSAITRNANPTLGWQWKLNREYALALPHDNETAPLFVHRHGVRRDLLHLKIFKRSIVSLHNTQDVQDTIYSVKSLFLSRTRKISTWIRKDNKKIPTLRRQKCWNHLTGVLKQPS